MGLGRARGSTLENEQSVYTAGQTSLKLKCIIQKYEIKMYKIKMYKIKIEMYKMYNANALSTNIMPLNQYPQMCNVPRGSFIQ